MTAIRRRTTATTPTTAYFNYLVENCHDRSKDIINAESLYNGYITHMSRVNPNLWCFRLFDYDASITYEGLCFHEEAAQSLQASLEQNVGCTVRGALHDGKLLTRHVVCDNNVQLLANISAQLTEEERIFFETHIDELSPSQQRNIWRMLKRPCVDRHIVDQHHSQSSFTSLRELRLRFLALKSHMPSFVRDKCESLFREVDRTFGPGSHQHSLMCALRCLINKDYTLRFPKADTVNLREALDQRFDGLAELKEAICDTVWLRGYGAHPEKCTPLLVVGPPGTGKTRIVEYTAQFLNVPFCHIQCNSLNGDPEAIAGSPSVYDNARPSRIATDLSDNLGIVLFDEVDKFYKAEHSGEKGGSAASALLDMLDGSGFMNDTLVGKIPTNNIIMICTANSLNDIPQPLLDRLRIINVYAYTQAEKTRICRTISLPRIVKQVGKELTLQNGVLEMLASDYSSDAGMRDLESILETLVVRAGRLGVECIDENFVHEVLNDVPCEKPSLASSAGEGNAVGVLDGQGAIFKVQAKLIDGHEIVMTGGFHKTIAESAELAIMHARKTANMPDAGIHLHLTGGIGKDGTSAGCVFYLTALSAMTMRPIEENVFVTGEIDLFGNVCPIGGVKAKLLAAVNAVSPSQVITFIVPAGPNYFEAQQLLRDKGSESIRLYEVNHITQLQKFLQQEQSV